VVLAPAEVEEVAVAAVAKVDYHYNLASFGVVSCHLVAVVDKSFVAAEVAFLVAVGHNFVVVAEEEIPVD
jgi:hypothetical protein